MNFLETILAKRRAGVEEARKMLSLPELKSRLSGMRPANDFTKRLFRASGEPVRIIAEIKRASPSKGVIDADIDPASVAKEYRGGGASAISILTEENYFKGSGRDLQDVRRAVPDVPLLRKDFVVDEYQIYESVYFGADAILLIVAALDAGTLRRFVSIADECGLGALVEVHADGELDVAISAGARIIGVNNRNLATFEVSAEVSERMAARIPAGIISVSESGIADAAGLRAASDLGYHAVLIGEHFMRSKNRLAEVEKFARPEMIK